MFLSVVSIVYILVVCITYHGNQYSIVWVAHMGYELEFSGLFWFNLPNGKVVRPCVRGGAVYHVGTPMEAPVTAIRETEPLSVSIAILK